MPFTFCHLLTSANTFFSKQLRYKVQHSYPCSSSENEVQSNPSELFCLLSAHFFFLRSHFSPAQYFHLPQINELCEGETTSALKSSIWVYQVANLLPVQCKFYIFQVRETHSLSVAFRHRAQLNKLAFGQCIPADLQAEPTDCAHNMLPRALL